MPTRVKICGITRREDALAAARAGADALGFVFYRPSPRFIEAQRAHELVAGIPPFVTLVGLFVNPTVEEVRQVLTSVKLDCLQFHGEESAAFCQQFDLPYLKALTVKPGQNVRELLNGFPEAQGILLDTYHPQLRGGTGQRFDWSQIPSERLRPLILAGGLTPELVADAIKQVRPYAVDVSGGVEASKGIKDHAKIQAFIHEVRQVDCS